MIENGHAIGRDMLTQPNAGLRLAQELDKARFARRSASSTSSRSKAKAKASARGARERWTGWGNEANAK